MHHIARFAVRFWQIITWPQRHAAVDLDDTEPTLTRLPVLGLIPAAPSSSDTASTESTADAREAAVRVQLLTLLGEVR